MTEPLIFNNLTYIRSRTLQPARTSPREYLLRLAPPGRIHARIVAGTWFVEMHVSLIDR
jgi:hypothetical protein